MEINLQQIIRASQVARVVKKSESCLVLSDSLQLHGLYSPWNSPGQNTGVGSCSILQGIFPTQGLNPGLRHCRRIHQLSHQGDPVPFLGREDPLETGQMTHASILGFPGGSDGEESTCNAGDLGWEDPLEGWERTHLPKQEP